MNSFITAILSLFLVSQLALASEYSCHFTVSEGAPTPLNVEKGFSSKFDLENSVVKNLDGYHFEVMAYRLGTQMFSKLAISNSDENSVGLFKADTPYMFHSLKAGKDLAQVQCWKDS